MLKLSITIVLSLLVSCQGEPSPRSMKGNPNKMGPGQVDDALIAAIQSEKYEDAYRLMSTPYRNTVSYSTFKAAVSRNVYLKNSREIGCGSTNTQSQGPAKIHKRECILKSDVGNTHAELFYTMEDGEWRMTGITLGGTPAFPSHDPVATESKSETTVDVVNEKAAPADR